MTLLCCMMTHFYLKKPGNKRRTPKIVEFWEFFKNADGGNRTRGKIKKILILCIPAEERVARRVANGFIVRYFPCSFHPNLQHFFSVQSRFRSRERAAGFQFSHMMGTLTGLRFAIRFVWNSQVSLPVHHKLAQIPLSGLSKILVYSLCLQFVNPFIKFLHCRFGNIVKNIIPIVLQIFFF